MNITSIQSTNYNNIGFTSNRREVRTKRPGMDLYRNDTYFFRHDLDWEAFTDKLVSKYKNQKKANIYCYGCSDGTEPFSLAMLLIKKLGAKEAEKFFPIIARDFDEQIISRAKSGEILLHIRIDENRMLRPDMERIQEHLGSKYEDFLTIEGMPLHIKEYKGWYQPAKIKKEIMDAVKFEYGDVTKDVKIPGRIKEKDSVLMFRNAWPYFNESGQASLFKGISKRLGDNSLFLFGSFDEKFSILNKLIAKSNLFEKDTLMNCYKKLCPPQKPPSQFSKIFMTIFKRLK